MKDKIIDLMKTKHNKMSMGEMLNYIQDRAEVILPEKDFNTFLVKANRDVKDCAGTDCLFVNGKVFDWKEFEPKKYEVVNAFLGYFSQNSLQKIYNVL